MNGARWMLDLRNGVINGIQNDEWMNDECGGVEIHLIIISSVWMDEYNLFKNSQWAEYNWIGDRLRWGGGEEKEDEEGREKWGWLRERRMRRRGCGEGEEDEEDTGNNNENEIVCGCGVVGGWDGNVLKSCVILLNVGNGKDGLIDWWIGCGSGFVSGVIWSCAVISLEEIIVIGGRWGGVGDRRGTIW